MKISGFLILFSALAFAPNYAYSQQLECNDNKAFIKSVSNEVIHLVTKEDLSDEQKQEQLTDLFKRLVNIQWMGKFVLGRNWNNLKEDQQKEYLDAYEGYLIRAYIPKFKEYSGQKIEILSTTPLRKQDEHLVTTNLKAEGEPDIEITYRIRKDGVCYQIYDIVAEGVSLINTQRQDFSSVYRNKGFKKLVALLASKKAE